MSKRPLSAAALLSSGLAGAMQPGWRDTRMTQGTPGPHPVFCYGSNGIEQMRERCRNPRLTAYAARLPGSVLVFGSWSERWEGAVASVQPLPNHEVLGSVVDLSAEELHLLDGFECVKSAEEPYAVDGGMYHRQDVVVLARRGGEAVEAALAAVMYVMINPEWKGPPSERYVAACMRNIGQFWQAQLSVRDALGQLRGAPECGGCGASSSSAAGSSSSAAGPSSSADEPDGVTHFDAVASGTVQTLVEAMGFPIELAATAVDAIGDKSDVGLAVSWLLEHGGEDHGGAVAFVHCPHLDDPTVRLLDPSDLTAGKHARRTTCEHGCESAEQWVCLQCGDVHCGRYLHKHALEHHQAHPTHVCAASLADLSVHCYACAAYVTHPRLEALNARLSALKFGEGSGSSS